MAIPNPRTKWRDEGRAVAMSLPEGMLSAAGRSSKPGWKFGTTFMPGFRSEHGSSRRFRQEDARNAYMDRRSRKFPPRQRARPFRPRRANAVMMPGRSISSRVHVLDASQISEPRRTADFSARRFQQGPRFALNPYFLGMNFDPCDALDMLVRRKIQGDRILVQFDKSVCAGDKVRQRGVRHVGTARSEEDLHSLEE